MTNALYARIEAIESFAADVSHELKNPLTSLRSAVETLPLAKSESSKTRLMDVIQHDVRRLDRLITDISDASRLDAELSREDAAKVDMKKFLGELVSVSRDIGRGKRKVEIDLKIGKLPQGVKGFFVQGHDLRLGQVVTNLIENARSFVADDSGRITVNLTRSGRHVIVTVDDNGPGIRADNIDRIFERFYTDRPSARRSGRIPASACRSAARSSRRMAARDGREYSRHQARRSPRRAFRGDAAGRRLTRACHRPISMPPHWCSATAAS